MGFCLLFFQIFKKNFLTSIRKFHKCNLEKETEKLKTTKTKKTKFPILHNLNVMLILNTNKENIFFVQEHNIRNFLVVSSTKYLYFFLLSKCCLYLVQMFITDYFFLLTE